MSSSWEARPACRETGDTLCPLGLRRWGFGCLPRVPAMGSPGLPPEGSGSGHAMSLPGKRKGEERGEGREGKKEEWGEENNPEFSHAAQILPGSRRAAGHRVSGRLCWPGSAAWCPGSLPAPAPCRASAPRTMAAPCPCSMTPCTIMAPGHALALGGASGPSVSPMSDTGAVLGCLHSLGTKGTGCSVVAVASSEHCSLCFGDRVAPVLVTMIAPSPCLLPSQGPTP